MTNKIQAVRQNRTSATMNAELLTENAEM